MSQNFDICIVGGCGHVGLPLGIAFADKNKEVVLYDLSHRKVDLVNKGTLPFIENGGDVALKRVLKNNKLHATTDPKAIEAAPAVIVVIGTPVDEHLNPRAHDIIEAIEGIAQYLSDDQLLVMRSTLYPGMTEKVHEYLQSKGKQTLVAFCPERISEGAALNELDKLPQIVGGCNEQATQEAQKLFRVLTKKVITTKPIEAEMAKLFTNTWRYINFAISNQFYMIANSHGLDFYKIYNAMIEDYPRLKSFAKAGFSAGPCLLQDTMQLSAFSGNNFFLGHSAMLTNEGLPDFVVDSMKKKYDLKHRKVAVLGMAFKGDSDDPRESLSYRLKKRLELEAEEVLCHDPYIKDPRFVPLSKIREQADIIVLAAPHTVYAKESWGGKELIDIWNFYGKGP